MSSPAATDDLVEITAAPPAPQRRSFEYHAIFLVLSIAILVLAATMSVNDGTKVTPPLLSTPLPELCNLRRFFGIDCPGCGMTRCFISIAHGDLLAAWNYNAGGILLFGLVVAQIPYRSAQMWRVSHGHTEWQPRRLMTWLSEVLVIMLLVQWCWRIYETALTLPR